MTLDLSAFVDDVPDAQFVVRFHHHQRNAAFAGWYIDDIELRIDDKDPAEDDGLGDACDPDVL